MNLKVKGCDGVDWIHLPQYDVQGFVLVNTVMMVTEVSMKLV